MVVNECFITHSMSASSRSQSCRIVAGFLLALGSLPRVSTFPPAMAAIGKAKTPNRISVVPVVSKCSQYSYDFDMASWREQQASLSHAEYDHSSSRNHDAPELGEPTATPSTALVEEGLERIYPLQDLGSRNAMSRTDGYWTFISRGEEPPQSLTYGEFDIPFFANLLVAAAKHFPSDQFASDDRSSQYSIWDGKVFCDLGSGAGRILYAAAALHPWKMCRGIELLPGLHQSALEQLAKCGSDESGSRTLTAADGESIPLSPVELRCGSFADPNENISDADLCFVFSTCFDEETMGMVGKFIGRQCKPGTIVITIDYPLPLRGQVEGKGYSYSVVEQIDGDCSVVGGTSTAFIQRLQEG